MSSATTRPISIAFLQTSLRTPRLSDHIAAWILPILSPLLAPHKITMLDLRDFPLPLESNEPLVPAQLPSPVPANSYVCQQTNAWSAEVSKHDAFIFLCPQYNHSLPASLKNAFDKLYHEWEGKPVYVISYGTRGGLRCAKHVLEVCRGLDMKFCLDEAVVGMKTDVAIGGGQGEAVTGLKLDKSCVGGLKGGEWTVGDKQMGIWEGQKGEVVGGAESFVKLIEASLAEK